MTRSTFTRLAARPGFLGRTGVVARAGARVALRTVAGRAVVGLALVSASMTTLGARGGHDAAAARATRAGMTSVSAAVSATAAAATQTDAQFTQADSDSFVRKMNAIERIGARAGGGGSASAASASASAAGATTARTRPGQPQLRLTTISERELNAYFRYDMRDQMPAGVTEPTITILGDGRLTATAVVDLDAVRNGQESSGWLNPMRLLRGRLPITASGVLESQHGTARFVLDAADVSGVTVPKALLQQVVSYYSRTSENPAGVNLDDAIELPAGIQEIRVQPGQAVVVQ